MSQLPDRLHKLLAAAGSPAELSRLALAARAQLSNTSTPAETGSANLFSDLADALTRRLLALAERDQGPPPVAYAWIAHGSQGRREMTRRSDQDNALILADDFAPAAHAAYFAVLADTVCDGLAACGFVHCPGGMMASRPDWRASLSDWQHLFSGWLQACDIHQARLASNLFDLRWIAGANALVAPLRALIIDRCPGADALLGRWIANAAAAPPALGLFQRLRRDADGRFDLKRNALIPIVELARIHALAAGIDAVGTDARLAAAAGKRWLSRRGADELRHDWRLLRELQQRQLAIADATDGNPRIDPDTLGREEKQQLSSALARIEQQRAALRLIYPDVPLR